MPEVKNLVTSKKPLVIVPVVLALVLAGLFLPVREVSIEPYGTLSLESKITISIGYEAAYASPDTERQSPDAIIEQYNLSGTVTDIQDDPDSPDVNWLTYIDNKTDTVCRVSFPTPTGNPTQGAGLQQFKIWVRRQPGAGIPQVQINLYEDGVDKGVILPLTNVNSATGELFSATWDANLLGTADGSLVECYIYGGAVGGAPDNRCTVEVGAVEWNVTYTLPPPLSNFPTSHNFGTVRKSSDYWSKGSEPIFPLDDVECLFEVTNNTSVAVDIVIRATNFNGGVGWTLADTPAEDTVTLKAGTSGIANEGLMKTLANSDQAFITGLGAWTPMKWELKMETPSSFSDGVQKQSIITLTATSS